MTERTQKPFEAPKAVQLHVPETAEQQRLNTESVHQSGGQSDSVRRSAGSAGAEPPPSSTKALLSEPAFYQSHHDLARAAVLNQLQRSYGNQSVQRFLNQGTDAGKQDTEQATVRGNAASAETVPSGVESHIEKTRGQGHGMSPDVRSRMEPGFGGDLSNVRLHTDTGSGDASNALGAQAFASGRDIYFGHGRYEPQSEEGQRLLAHEIAHTAQQSDGPSPPKSKLSLGLPDDPQEREADRIADTVVQGLSVKDASGRPDNTIAIRRADDTASSTAPVSPPEPVPAVPTPTPEPHAAGDDAIVINLGRGIRIAQDVLTGRRNNKRADLTKQPQTVPGLALKTLTYWPNNKSGKISAELNVPFARELRSDLKLNFNAEGKATFRGNAKLPVNIGALNNPELNLTVDDTGQVAATLAVTANKMKPRGLPKLSIEGGGEIHLAQGKLGGNVNATLDYKGLAKGDFNLGFQDGTPKGGGKIDITQEFLKGASIGLAVEEGNLKADVTVPASKIAPPIPGLEVPEGSIQLIMNNGDLSGVITGLRLVYRDFGEGTLASATISKGVVSGSGQFTISIPALAPVTGAFGYKSGRLSGKVTVKAEHFPKSLQIESGSITGSIDEKGQVGLRTNMAVSLGGVGSGNIRAGYEKGKLDLGADVSLAIPGLEGTSARIDYVNGQLEGEVDIPIQSDKLAGLGGNLHVEYREGLWKGEQTIAYERDNGKLSGNVKLGLMQKEKGDLVVYGGGDITAQLTDFLAGTLGLEILPEGTTTISGAITVTEPIELFSEKKTDRELFSISRNIPLWAILVAVIRLRAGVRAGIGPGQLRDITVEGEYTIGEETPSFVISGELFIPAFAEAYVAFGAGLGLDVVLGSLTGGIEAVGTAGVYGAVSVLPEIAYENGNYSINGTATMAAAAKIKLGLQAWAEVEALWITVWENTWQLAEWVWDVGPTLALQANMSYTFGQPEPPSIDVKTSDIDAERLIQDAMPKEGPKGSGAREALKNKAEWSGRSKGKGKDADKVPDEAAGKEKKPATPKAPPKPSKKTRPKGDEADAKRPVKEKGGKRTPELEKTINDAAKDKAKKATKEGPGQVQFPQVSNQEIEINWANYLKDKSGNRTIERSAFESKMRGGEVYHPKQDRWRSIKDDYQRAYDSMKEGDRNPAGFARKMRNGYIVSSAPKPDPQWDSNLNVPVPDADGSPEKPYSIHWPNEFLVKNFRDFTVQGGVKISKSGNKEYTFDIGGREKTYSFGVSPSFNNKMGLGKKLQRQNPNRNASKTATAWNHWDEVGFTGSTGSSNTAATDPFESKKVQIGDESMFARNKNPYTNEKLDDLTFKQYLEQQTPSAFTHYAQATPSEQDRLRGAARKKEIDLRDQPGHVQEYLSWYRTKQAALANMRGHAGYEMQHAVPLFLVGSTGDVRANMWPLTVAQHRLGHRILANQPQLKTDYNLPTHDLESNKLLLKPHWFQIVKHGSSI